VKRLISASVTAQMGAPVAVQLTDAHDIKASNVAA
jgi:hypothetical protein